MTRKERIASAPSPPPSRCPASLADPPTRVSEQLAATHGANDDAPKDIHLKLLSLPGRRFPPDDPRGNGMFRAKSSDPSLTLLEAWCERFDQKLHEWELSVSELQSQLPVASNTTIDRLGLRGSPFSLWVRPKSLPCEAEQKSDTDVRPKPYSLRSIRNKALVDLTSDEIEEIEEDEEDEENEEDELDEEDELRCEDLLDLPEHQSRRRRSSSLSTVSSTSDISVPDIDLTYTTSSSPGKRSMMPIRMPPEDVLDTESLSLAPKRSHGEVVILDDDEDQGFSQAAGPKRQKKDPGGSDLSLEQKLLRKEQVIEYLHEERRERKRKHEEEKAQLQERIRVLEQDIASLQKTVSCPEARSEVLIEEATAERSKKLDEKERIYVEREQALAEEVQRLEERKRQLDERQEDLVRHRECECGGQGSLVSLDAAGDETSTNTRNEETLQNQLDAANNENTALKAEVAALKAEINRLGELENKRMTRKRDQARREKLERAARITQRAEKGPNTSIPPSTTRPILPTPPKV